MKLRIVLNNGQSIDVEEPNFQDSDDEIMEAILEDFASERPHWTSIGGCAFFTGAVAAVLPPAITA